MQPRPSKVFLRNFGKAEFEYHLPIECEVSGRNDSGEEIPIDKVGKWLFGVPGYMGHVRVTNWEGRDCTVEYPQDSRRVVHELLQKIRERIEGRS